jgi:hypothetical protein
MTEFEIMTLIDITIDFISCSAKLSPRCGNVAIDIVDDIQHQSGSRLTCVRLTYAAKISHFNAVLLNIKPVQSRNASKHASSLYMCPMSTAS